jgi:glutamate-1-semialdehyde 2,1-aminomutase
MELGGLDHNRERVFLMSTTYGGETHHLKVAAKVLEILNRNDYEVTKHLSSVGRELKNGINQIAKDLGIEEFVQLKGIETKPYMDLFSINGMDTTLMRNILQQETAKHGVLFLNIAPSLGHGQKEIDQSLEAFSHALKSLKEAASMKDPRSFLVGEISKPVFRKYN